MKMKKILSCLLVAVMIMVLMPQAITVFAHEYSDDRVDYLVVAKNEASYNVINREYENEKCEEKTVSDESIVLSLTEGEAESIEEYAGTAYIEKDILFKEFSEDIAPEDLIEDFLGGETECAEEDYPANIYMVNGDNVNLASEENIVVGVLDSGIANHSDLNVTKRVCLIPDMYVDNNLFSYDLSGHGTGVAGVIGAKNDDKGIIGIYENVELYSIQVLTPMGEAPLSRIVAGIDWAIENGVDVLNMSFGTSVNSEILYDAIVRANNSGMVLVAAAGNTENATQYPAKYSEVISVGSVDGSGNISDFSAKDDYVDIYAPGESIISTTIVGGYTAANGTSLAAPHVTAAAALIKAVNGQRTTAEIRNLILATANTSVENNAVGILDIENMLALADEFDYTNTQTTYQNETSFDEYNQDDIVVGCWSATNHWLMTAEVYDDNNETWKQDEGIANILEDENNNDNNNFRLMIATSYLADKLYGTKVEIAGDYKSDENATKETRYDFYPLHANGNDIDASVSGNPRDYNSNYVADVKYLFGLAKCYMDYNLDDNEVPSVSDILDAISELDENNPNANIDDLQKIVRQSQELYKNEHNYYFGLNSENKLGVIKAKNQETSVKGIIYMDVLENFDESNPCARGFKILGLALHLVGDVYAHRTRVPLSSVNDGSYFPETITDSDFYVAYDFILNHNSNKNFTAQDLNHYLRYKNNGSVICKCYDCFRSAISSGRVEFRDIANYHDGNALFFKADNIEFYGKRYTIATRHATENLISLFLNNEEFSIDTFIPTEATYTLKLNYLKGYIIEAGFNWNNLESSKRTQIESLSTIAEI